MTTATLRIPAKSTQISMGQLGYGLDILASISLGALADALGRMEHDDLDPGERPMNADQCRDALLRELLGGWSPSELVEARIPGVLQMADEIATLRRERDEALADVESLRKALSKSSDNLLDAMTDIGRLHQQITTPTPGSQP